MYIKIIGNQMFEILEILEFGEDNKNYIVRQSDEAFLYSGYGRYIFNISEINDEIKNINSVIYIDDETKKSKVEFLNRAIDIMRKYNRNVIIDELMSGIKRNSLEGLSSLVLAC